MKLLCDLTLEDLQKVVATQEDPPFVAGQIAQWVYEKNIPSWKEMTNLSHQQREKYAVLYPYPSLILKNVTSDNQSDQSQRHKFLWELSRQSYVESLLISSQQRNTLYIAAQVGGSSNWPFCSSQRGVKRNLKVGEIVEQVIHMNRWLVERGQKITEIIYQGSAEPLKNYDALLSSIKILSHPRLFNFPQRSISILTTGFVEEIRQLSHESLKVNLILALHASNPSARKKSIAYGSKYPLDQILTVLDEYSSATKAQISYEYRLIEGVNDHPDHAFELAHLLNKRRGSVRITSHLTKGPSKKAIKSFRSVLFGAHIPNTFS